MCVSWAGYPRSYCREHAVNRWQDPLSSPFDNQDLTFSYSPYLRRPRRRSFHLQDTAICVSRRSFVPSRLFSQVTVHHHATTKSRVAAILGHYYTPFPFPFYQFLSICTRAAKRSVRRRQPLSGRLLQQRRPVWLYGRSLWRWLPGQLRCQSRVRQVCTRGRRGLPYQRLLQVSALAGCSKALL